VHVYVCVYANILTQTLEQAYIHTHVLTQSTVQVSGISVHDTHTHTHTHTYTHTHT
jgi:hypothetical protein